MTYNLLSSIFFDLGDRIVNFGEMELENALGGKDAGTLCTVDLCATDEGVVGGIVRIERF